MSIQVERCKSSLDSSEILILSLEEKNNETNRKPFKKVNLATKFNFKI